MELDFNSDRPIFQQIAEGLEDGILSGGLPGGKPDPLHHRIFPCCIRSTLPPP